MTDNLQDKGSSNPLENSQKNSPNQSLSPEEKERKLMDLYHEISMIFKNADKGELTQKQNEKLTFLNAQIDTLLDFHIGFSKEKNEAKDPFDQVLDELDEHFSGIKDRTQKNRKLSEASFSREQEKEYGSLINELIDEVDDKL